MAKRTPEEVLAQREAWLARKAARDAGEDMSRLPPLKPGEAPPETVAAASAAAEPAPEPEPVAAAATEPAPVQAAPPKVGPQKPSGKRSPEELRAQREAWLARKAGGEAPAPAPVAEKPAVATAQPAAKAPVATAKPAAAPPPTAEPPVDPNLTRRELLNYAWLASIALFSLETVGFSLWFAFPNFKEGQFGGEFRLGEAGGVLPEVNSGPVAYTDGKFWLVNVDTEVNGEPRQGVLAIYKVCTHLGCLYEWIPMTGRFECPCHGSKFALTGDYIAGPARRSLDRFVIKTLGPDGAVKAQTPPDGSPISIDPGDQLVIDTGQRILGSSDIVPA